jgi:nucleotide-binding universal stress UspA family protein
LRILNGKAEEAVPAFAAERDYDAMVMGALTHRPGMVALVGTLTSKLVDTVACDFVLVKSQD